MEILDSKQLNKILTNYRSRNDSKSLKNIYRIITAFLTGYSENKPGDLGKLSMFEFCLMEAVNGYDIETVCMKMLDVGVQIDIFYILSWKNIFSI